MNTTYVSWHTHTHTHKYARAHTDTQKTHVCTDPYEYAHDIQTDTYRNTLRFTQIHRNKHMHMTNICTDQHIHAQIHTEADTHSGRYTQTQTHTNRISSRFRILSSYFKNVFHKFKKYELCVTLLHV